MSQKSSEFEKVLGRWDVIALSFGAMIGWGWVVLAGDWINSAGSFGAMLAFIIGGIMIALVGLTYSELCSAMPQIGGGHVYAYRALGVNSSFICTWAIILGYVSVVAFEAVALPTVVEYLFPNYEVGYMWTIAGWDVYASWVAVGVIGSIALTIVNYYGVKNSAFLQSVFTILIVLGGLMLVSGSLFVNGTGENLKPFFVDGTSGIFAVLIMVPFMLVGFDVIPQAAEEINLPQNQIGKVLILSVIMAVAWYVFIILGVGLTLTDEQMQTATLATADAATAAWGSTVAGKLLILAGIGGILTSWNSFYIGGSRAIYALAKAKMLPSFLAKLHPVHKTPVNAVLLIGFLSVIAPFFGRVTLVWLVNSGGLGIVIAYFVVAISFVVLRKKEPNMPRPFKVSNGALVGYGAVLMSFLLILCYMPFSPAALAWQEWIIFGGWSVLGVALFGWARNKYKNQAETIMGARIEEMRNESIKM